MSKSENPSPIVLSSLTDSQARALVSLLDHSSVVVEVTDPEGRLLFVNRFFEEVTGYSQEEALGSSSRELLWSDDHDPALFGAISETLRAGKVWDGIYAGRRKDGSSYQQLVRIEPIFEQEELLYLAVVKQPFLEGVESAALHAARKDSIQEELLAVRKSLRTANEDLIASASMAVIGQLAAAVGHEINNPAQVLRSCLEHLAENAGHLSGADLAEVLDDAMTALRRIETVTTELVPFAGSAQEEAVEVDLNECAQRGLRMAHNELRHRLTISERLGAVPPVNGVRARLAQLVAGLLVSIARAVDEDSDSHIDLTSISDESYVCLRVVCRGAGAGPFFQELQNRLVQWDSEHPPPTSRWISLILCQQIAIGHGGTLLVEEVSSDGGTVLLRLPRSERAVADEAPQFPRVLVIDDEVLVLRSQTRMLRAHYQVEMCDNGKRAVDLICEGDFDAIICDIMMPGMSGVAVHDALLARKPEAIKKLIFISAGTFTDKTVEFEARCKQPVLKKPLRHDQLTSALEALIDSSE